jgi:hypothetical protein
MPVNARRSFSQYLLSRHAWAAILKDFDAYTLVVLVCVALPAALCAHLGPSRKMVFWGMVSLLMQIIIRQM